MISEDLIAQFRADRDRHERNARSALEELRQHAEYALAQLDYLAENGSWSFGPTVGGSFLNSQRWEDAERNLVRFWDAAGVVANLERENERGVTDGMVDRAHRALANLGVNAKGERATVRDALVAALEGPR